jgi:hypothetical protein
MGGSTFPVMYWAIFNTPWRALWLVDRAIPIPGHDATGQNTFDGATVVFRQDPGWDAISSAALGSRDAVALS